MFISGDVTGVGYRAWTVREATRLELKGWVRNADRNLVELVCEGAEDIVNKYIDICKNGPETSLVADIEVKWEKTGDDLAGFEIRY